MAGGLHAEGLLGTLQRALGDPSLEGGVDELLGLARAGLQLLTEKVAGFLPLRLRSSVAVVFVNAAENVVDVEPMYGFGIPDDGRRSSSDAEPQGGGAPARGSS